MRIPVLLFQLNTVESLGRRFKGFGRMLAGFMPGMNDVLRKIGMDVSAEAYTVSSFFSSFIYGLFFFLVAMIALTYRGADQVLYISLGFGILFWVVFYLLHIIYPGIIMKKIATLVIETLFMLTLFAAGWFALVVF